MAEPTGFREYVAAHNDRWIAAAWLLTGDRHAAEDVVQQALASVWPHWSRVSGDSDPDAYVRKAIFNKFVSGRRRRWRGEAPVGMLPPEHCSELEIDEQAAARDEARRLLSTLAPRQRAVLVLRFFEDCSERETAELLGCSVGTVKSQTARALVSLRQVVEVVRD